MTTTTARIRTAAWPGGSVCRSGTYSFDGGKLTRTFVDASGKTETTVVAAELEGDDGLRVHEPEGDVVYRRAADRPAICKL